MNSNIPSYNNQTSYPNFHHHNFPPRNQTLNPQAPYYSNNRERSRSYSLKGRPEKHYNTNMAFMANQYKKKSNSINKKFNDKTYKSLSLNKKYNLIDSLVIIILKESLPPLRL